MALASLDHVKRGGIAGLVKVGRQLFEYRPRKPCDFGADFAPEFNLVVFVGPEGQDLRLASLIKTRIRIVVDESNSGAPVVESWPISMHRPYA